MWSRTPGTANPTADASIARHKSHRAAGSPIHNAFAQGRERANANNP